MTVHVLKAEVLILASVVDFMLFASSGSFTYLCTRARLCCGCGATADLTRTMATKSTGGVLWPWFRGGEVPQEW